MNSVVCIYHRHINIYVTIIKETVMNLRGSRGLIGVGREGGRGRNDTVFMYEFSKNKNFKTIKSSYLLLTYEVLCFQDFNYETEYSPPLLKLFQVPMHSES